MFSTQGRLREPVDLSDYWYVLCESGALGTRPHAVTLRDRRLVAFRDAAGEASVLLDRCPHRHVPLSLGKVSRGELVCAYHGWRFGADGRCSSVPGRCHESLPSARVPRFPSCERDGYVWVWARPDTTPGTRPPSLPTPPGYGEVRQVIDYRAGLHESLENTIDLPHTYSLHRGLLRAPRATKTIRCTLTRGAGEVTARYDGERRPDTWLARLLVPGDGTLQHEDRFMLPSIVRVEYRVADHTHLISHACFTPRGPAETRLHAHTVFKVGHLPNRVLAPLLQRVAGRVLQEDAEILRLQHANIAHFGTSPFASTELDTFSEWIRRLLTDADRGSAAAPPDGAYAFDLKV